MNHNIKTISSGSYTAKINISRGANCISLKNSKYNASLLREPEINKELDNPYLYGMPILFPANRISGGKFEFEGREYSFDINEPATDCHLHGHIHETPFTITEERENFISCVYENNGNDIGFPHKYRIKTEYLLSDNGLLHTTEIKNLSDKNMPVFLGFHTTFNIPFIKDTSPENIRIHTQIGEEIERNKIYLPTGIIKTTEVTKKLKSGTFKPFEKIISVHCDAKDEGLIEITDTEKRIKVVYENDEKYKFRLIYNGNADTYICLEPMNCMANCQNSPFDREISGFDYIKPGCKKTYTSKIYIAEI